jgi:hypothetical protein
MLGRGDANNRFNLFDNNSAFPTNRIWFSYELMQNFQTGVRIGTTLPTDLATQIKYGLRHDQDLYRIGAEIALSSRCSISFEDQYVATEGDDHAPDAWANPQILLKYAVCETATSALSATFGFQPEVSNTNGSLHEKDTRFLPGVLFFQGCGKAFVQGGAQFGISDSNLSNTFDWVLATGCWIYRAETTECHKPWLTGISPMIEVYGKHVLANSQNQPFGIPESSSALTTGAPFREDRNVLDVTAGGRILLHDCMIIGTAVSFPVTGPDVRRTEFLANVTFRF